ncbi:TrbC/VirB2 family protein [Wolbachia endosymbiont of Folsomia candida]|uniref:TrbC/VirB2 family protein n=1 Tax=Wolbachia endosymbiont of Folsomia candida TaxID=169402 RepID=UPI000B61ECE1|nr:TrbC/VirB2 family protein [Wolbachia endosymbiont of Folsomia candida]APR99181.1 hypothetical protein ASM33_03685 [Wolbachia endosymbiont of Folsomia candida]
MKFFNILIVALIFSFAFDANADETTTTICNIVDYTKTLGGPMITIVIIGAALLSMFGRMPWPALFALGMFTAVFFGAPAIVKTITGKEACGTNSNANAKQTCETAGKTWNSSTSTCS